MAKARDILGSGALGIGPAILAKNPEMLQGFGLMGNLAYNALDNKEKKKQEELTGVPAQPGMPETTMKKGGKVKKMAKGGSASKRADGCAQKGKTRGKMI